MKGFMKLLENIDYKIFEYQNNEYIFFLINAFEVLVVDEKTKNVIIAFFDQQIRIKDIIEQFHVREDELNNLNEMITNLLGNKKNKGVRVEKSINIDVEFKINISHICNMACLYCYADYKDEQKIMSIATAENIAIYIEENYKNNNIKIGFFGGEPLMNFEVIKYLCKRLENGKPISMNNYYYGLVTNGTILDDDIIDLFHQYNFQIRISIDGMKDIHNKLRPYKKGNGTYDDVSKNIKIFKAKAKFSVNYEATYTCYHEHMNISRNDIRDFLNKEFNFDQSLIVDVSDPVWFAPQKKDYRNNCNDFENYIMHNEHFSFRFSKFINKKRSRFICSIGKTHFVITPNGNIYPCQLFISEKNKLILGNINDLSNFDPNTLLLMDDLDHQKNSNCQVCWCRHLCKDCPVSYYNENKSFLYNEEKCSKLENDYTKFIIDISNLMKNSELRNKYLKKLEERKRISNEN